MAESKGPATVATNEALKAGAKVPFGGKQGRKKDYGYDLTEADKLCLANLSAAKKACGLAAEQIRRGNDIPGEVIRAASMLAGATGALLSRD